MSHFVLKELTIYFLNLPSFQRKVKNDIYIEFQTSELYDIVVKSVFRPIFLENRKRMLNIPLLVLVK